MRRLDLTRERGVASRPLAAPNDAFRASVVEAARRTTGLHELYVLQYAAPQLSPPRGVLFAIIAAPGADLGSTGREFHAQIALRFDRTEAFHYAVGTTASAALLEHCVPDALWHQTRFTTRPPPRHTPGPRSIAPPSIPPAPRLPSVEPSSSVPPAPRSPVPPRPSPPPPAPVTLADLVDRFALLAWDKQEHHLEVHEGCAVSLDLSGGALVFTEKGIFGKTRRYRAQVLGAEVGRSWVWAWADGDRSIAQNLRAASHVVRRRGLRDEVPELTTGTLPLGGLVGGESLACVSSGITDASFYFRVPTNEGGLYLLVADPTFPAPTEDPLIRALTTLPRAFAAIEIPHHRAAVLAYFRGLGVTVDEHRRELHARSRDGHALRAEFDERGRLVVLETI